MKYLILIRFMAGLLSALLVSSALGQSQWRPIGSINSYDPNNKILRLPSVTLLPEAGAFPSFENFYNVILEARSDTLFELVSMDELQPEQECTVAEVQAAIPLLSSQMTVEEGDALIGCMARISRGAVDLVSGALTFATWTGLDGVPNSGAVSSFNPSRYLFFNVVSTNNPNPLVYNPFVPSQTFLSFSPSSSLVQPGIAGSRVSVFGSPFISLTLREGVFESYSYSTGGRTNGVPQLACSNTLETRFDQLMLGSALDDVVAILGCDGSQGMVTVSAAGELNDYQWQFISPGQINLLGIASRQTQTISVQFLNNMAESVQLLSSASISSELPCTVEDLVAASERISVGDVVTDIAALLSCGTRQESLIASITPDDSQRSISIQWRTGNPNNSPYTAPNRLLAIQVIGDSVTAVSLQRF